MNIKFISSSFFFQLFFYSSAFIVAIAVDPGDYVFVDLKNADISIKDLHTLLDKRGLPYQDFHEKSEYVNALIESGPLTVGELKNAHDSEIKSISLDGIEELVIDLQSSTYEKTISKSSEIWLIRINPTSNSRIDVLEEVVWHQLKTTLSTFEVQFGRVNCEEAVNFCRAKGWNSPTLILVVPRLYNSTQNSTKAEVYNLERSKNSLEQRVYEVDAVVNQVYSLLYEKLVPYLPSREDFDSLQTDELKCSVHIVLLTDMRQCPFLLSSLAAKFNYGSHCFAFGPKTIANGVMDFPDNYVGAFYAIKSHDYYSNRWHIIPQNQSTADTIDGMSNAMVTFESLSDLLNQLSPTETKQPKRMKRDSLKNVKKRSPLINTAGEGQPRHTTAYGVIWALIIFIVASLLLIFCGRCSNNNGTRGPSSDSSSNRNKEAKYSSSKV